MALFPEGDSDLTDQAAQALRLPIGLMSPLWFAYGAVASAGVAFWLVSKFAKPFNLEAEMGSLPALFETPSVPAVVTQTLAALQPEPVAPPADPILDPAVDGDEPVAVLAEEISETALPVEEAVGEAAISMSTVADDLTRLAGIGPMLAAKLAELGVNTYADIAAWTEDDLAKVDKALELRGRAVREAWIDQARQFAAQ